MRMLLSVLVASALVVSTTAHAQEAAPRLLPSEQFAADLAVADQQLTWAQQRASNASLLKGIGVSALVLSLASLAAAFASEAAALSAATYGLVMAPLGRTGTASGVAQSQATAQGLFVTSGVLAVGGIVSGLAGLGLGDGAQAAIAEAEERRTMLLKQQVRAAMDASRTIRAQFTPQAMPEPTPLDTTPPRKPLRPVVVPAVKPTPN